jgi:hypothetical protein
MKLVGIVDAHDFRAQILRRRELLKHGQNSHSAAVSAASDETVVLLRAILNRLEEISTNTRTNT